MQPWLIDFYDNFRECIVEKGYHVYFWVHQEGAALQCLLMKRNLKTAMHCREREQVLPYV